MGSGGSPTGGIFAGLTVLDIGSYLAAPAAATMLGDHGADVIKVEALTGDPWRNSAGRPASATGQSFQWRLIGRNKRSISLDLKSEIGQSIVHRLVETADVVITNLPTRTLPALGLDYDRLAAINPRLIYGLITAYGEHGPDAATPGYDTTAWWARSGLMDWMRPSSDAPPSKLAIGLGDQMSGLSLFGAISAALYQRERTGAGGRVTTSLLATAVWGNGVATQAAIEGEDLDAMRSAMPANPCAFRYRCSDDRWLVVLMLGAQADALWPRLASITGLADLADDPTLATLADRRAAAPMIVERLADAFALRPSAEWRERLEAARIPCAPMQRTEDILTDPQAEANGMLINAESGGQTIASPMTFSGTGASTLRSAPALGEHSAEILREIGLSDDAIRALSDAGTVRVGA